MTIPINPAPIDIFLQPGEIHFADRGTRIRTLLGSCVSITFWHAQRQLGGMCHFMLPGRGARRPVATPPDGRYADEAFALLEAEMRAVGTRMDEYQSKLFGGGRMFDLQAMHALPDIGSRNIEAARRLLARHARAPVSEHLAGFGHRSLIFEIASGAVWLRHLNEKANLKDVA